MGSYVLSSGFYDAYYRKAQQVRRIMQEKMSALFDQCDVIIGPTSPELAWPLGDSVNDPLRNYLLDLYTIPANMGGYPAMHIPTTTIVRDGIPHACGVQIMANHWREDNLRCVGAGIE